MATLQDLMGAGIPAGLLDPQQQQALEQRARNQGLLNLGFAVLQASQGQPGQGRPGLGQIVAQAGPAFGQAYQGAFDKTLTDILRAQQVQDMQAKRQAEDQRQAAFQQLTQRPTLTEEQRLGITAFPEMAQNVLFPKPEETSQLYRDYLMATKDPINPFTGSFMDYQTELKKAGRTQVTATATAGGGQQYAGEFAKGLAQDDLKLRSAAESAPASLQTIETTKKLLEDGKVFTGAFANKRLALAAAGQSLGLTGKNTDELIANTQQLFANRAKATLDNVKNSGLGAGQGFTDRDREFLEKAVLGNIEFSIDSLKRQIEIEEKVAKGTINKWNSRLKDLPQDVIKMGGVKPVQANRIIEVDY